MKVFETNAVAQNKSSTKTEVEDGEIVDESQPKLSIRNLKSQAPAQKTLKTSIGLKRYPPRPLNAFVFFRKTFRSNYPHVKTDFQNQSNEKWKRLSAKGKQPFYRMAEEDSMRYKNQLQELNEKGFYIGKDGNKSTGMLLSPRLTSAKKV